VSFRGAAHRRMRQNSSPGREFAHAIAAVSQPAPTRKTAFQFSRQVRWQAVCIECVHASNIAWRNTSNQLLAGPADRIFTFYQWISARLQQSCKFKTKARYAFRFCGPGRTSLLSSRPSKQSPPSPRHPASLRSVYVFALLKLRRVACRAVAPGSSSPPSPSAPARQPSLASRAKVGGPAWTRTRNQTVMSGESSPENPRTLTNNVTSSRVCSRSVAA